MQSTNRGHFPDRIGIWKCRFLKRRENRSTRRKTSRGKDENQQQTQPTYDAEFGNRTGATLVGGECSHHCANSAPLNFFLLPRIDASRIKCNSGFTIRNRICSLFGFYATHLSTLSVLLVVCVAIGRIIEILYGLKTHYKTHLTEVQIMNFAKA